MITIVARLRDFLEADVEEGPAISLPIVCSRCLLKEFATEEPHPAPLFDLPVTKLPFSTSIDPKTSHLPMVGGKSAAKILL